MQDKILKTIEDTIRVVVNGKIDKLHEEFIKHKQEEDAWQHEIKEHLTRQDDKLDALKTETAPIVESKNTLMAIRKFLLWVAAPFGILWAIWEYIISKAR